MGQNTSQEGSSNTVATSSKPHHHHQLDTSNGNISQHSSQMNNNQPSSCETQTNIPRNRKSTSTKHSASTTMSTSSLNPSSSSTTTESMLNGVVGNSLHMNPSQSPHIQASPPTVKILLLGLNGAGKSTIISKLKEYIQQQQISSSNMLFDSSSDHHDIHLNKTFRDIIHFHALNGIKQLILASEKLDISIVPRHSDRKEEIEFAIRHLRTLHFCYGEHVLVPEVAEMMKLLWEQRGAKEIHSEFKEFQAQQQQLAQQQQQQQHLVTTLGTSSVLNSSSSQQQQQQQQQHVDNEEEDVKAVAVKPPLSLTVHTTTQQPSYPQQFNAGEINCFTLYKDLYNLDYFMDHIDRIAQHDYVPTNEDVEYCQKHLKEEKKGIEEIEFNFSGERYIIYCVEGQNNDGRKWLFLFQGVDIVMFVCPIGDYDIVPTSLERHNVVKESLNFFSRMCNSKWFRSTPIILLLSKWDLFHEKVSHTSLNVCFEDYDGDNSYQHSLKFLLQKFNHVRDKGMKSVNTNIYQQFFTKETPHEELANNLGGCIKGIRMEQKEQARKAIRKQQLDSSTGEFSPNVLSDSVSSNGSPSLGGKHLSPQMDESSGSLSSKHSHKLFSGLLNKLKKK
ncbi:hypothetical protein C9374_011416 [Naegleria lovaniensis]|uniref:G domain-containing protein n=1 Tax=Naegleria lovaniensis TaxID=51637 RepID=A0AA88KQR8_NAELO|nr:uncharacterized protein C9374_011416 [Naegleria lovaniensis]KAG2392691.1 hypothetical protein C9374_011416 [Naegleria lovaniensis]